MFGEMNGFIGIVGCVEFWLCGKEDIIGDAACAV